MIDRAGLLGDLKPLLAMLEEDIRARVETDGELAEQLASAHAEAQSAHRTAMSLQEWSGGEITQAAAAWILGCVFVRFLEDNQLIDTPLLSGPAERRAAALGHREEYFRGEPQNSDREYLEHVFSTVARFPAVAPLYDPAHNPLWALGPSADGATALAEFWTTIDPDSGALVHDFTDAESRTRFLGDLYQDLSETAKKRYALLQTPIFVEELILDRTLGPAIAEFGLDETRLIDPTCGSGHFLIGAFERLFALWQDREPGTNVTVLAQRALAAVHGVDLNPYATAISRFRLLIAALRVCRIGRLAEAPAFKLNLATGDSLLHGAAPGELFSSVAHRKGISHVFAIEDADELQRILGKGYHAVVGNPPYITGDDPALRDAYRDRYQYASGLFALTVPFFERFFELARQPAGYVGQITANSMLRREFGFNLVEGFFPSVDLQAVLDCSGAYIPGHGTPTMIVFGRARPPVGATVRVVDGVRGEPRQPEHPAAGHVWTSIVSLVDAPGQGDTFVRASDIPRSELAKHPITLGAGRDVKRRLESVSSLTPNGVAVAIGRLAASSADDALDLPEHVWRRRNLHQSQLVRPSVDGASVRDWTAPTLTSCFFPYESSGLVVPEDQLLKPLWALRTVLWARRTFGKESYRQEGRAWFSWHQVAADRLATPLTITWGEVATHNHFVLDRGGKVFKQTAPVIKLPVGASEEEHLGLLGVLNSSVACFWLKQVCQPKGGDYVGQEGARVTKSPWEDRYALNASNVQDLPLPATRPAALPSLLDQAAAERASLLADLDTTPLAAHLAGLQDRDGYLRRRLISLQEELDWQVLAAYGLVPTDLPVLGEDAPPIDLGQRAFEIVLARQAAAGETETTWFERHGSIPITDVPADWPADYREVVEQRIVLIESDPDVALIERPENKRRWAGRPWRERERDALRDLVLDALEAEEIWAGNELRSTAQLTDSIRTEPLLREAVERLADERDDELAKTVQRLVVEASAPHLAVLRLNEQGLRKRAVWEDVWELQRAEDAGRVVRAIPVPPRYSKADFRSAIAWNHRGKLDVPKERFVLYADAERGADTSPVLGWAGWDERDRARALAARVLELRQQDAAEAERLTPLLAGLLELLPWIHQWRPDAEPTYGGPPGAWFETFLDQQLGELGLTREALRGWRPPETARRRRSVAAA